MRNVIHLVIFIVVIIGVVILSFWLANVIWESNMPFWLKFVLLR